MAWRKSLSDSVPRTAKSLRRCRHGSRRHFRTSRGTRVRCRSNESSTLRGSLTAKPRKLHHSVRKQPRYRSPQNPSTLHRRVHREGLGACSSGSKLGECKVKSCSVSLRTCGLGPNEHRCFVVQGFYTAGGLCETSIRGKVCFARLRGVASPGFADVCCTNVDLCALVLLNQVQSMRHGAREMLKCTLPFARAHWKRTYFQ